MIGLYSEIITYEGILLHLICKLNVVNVFYKEKSMKSDNLQGWFLLVVEVKTLLFITKLRGDNVSFKLVHLFLLLT